MTNGELARHYGLGPSTLAKYAAEGVDPYDPPAVFRRAMESTQSRIAALCRLERVVRDPSLWPVEASDVRIPNHELAARYSVSPRTIARWRRQGIDPADPAQVAELVARTRGAAPTAVEAALHNL